MEELEETKEQPMQRVAAGQTVSVVESEDSGVVANKKSSNKSKLIVIIAVVLAVIIDAVVTVIALSKKKKAEDELTGDDLAAYKLLVEASFEFKNPTSVRVLAGCVHYSEDNFHWVGWFTISATNGYGAKMVGYYYVGYLDGEMYLLDLEENDQGIGLSLSKRQGELNVDKINKKLAEKWENT